MKGFWTPWLDKLLAWWKSSTFNAKLRIGVPILIMVAGLGVGLEWVGGPHWSVLYTNLSASSAGQVTTELEQLKIPYQLSQGGLTVMVPKSDVDQARVTLADHSIPSSGTVSYGATPTFTLGETSSEIEAAQLVTLEDQLAQTIGSITGVTNAKVFINEPPPSLFGESQNPPTASVFINTEPLGGMSSSQVQGIMNLVADAVQGLTPDHVSVVDQNGTVLSAEVTNQNTADSNASTQLQVEKTYDQTVEQSVQSMLTQVLGPGAAVVRVSSVINFSKVQTSSVSYPNKGTVSAQQTQKQTGTGTTTAATGTNANTPGYTAGTGTSPSSSTSATQQYDVSQTNTQTSIPPGAVERMTIAVAVDATLTGPEQRKLTTLVTQASGAQTKSGDQVTVLGLPFNVSEAKAQAVTLAKQAKRAQEIQWGEEGLAGLIALFILWRLRAWWKKVTATPDAPVDASTEGMPLVLDEQTLEDLMDKLKDGASSNLTMGDAALQQLSEVARNNPEEVAKALKALLTPGGEER